MLSDEARASDTLLARVFCCANVSVLVIESAAVRGLVELGVLIASAVVSESAIDLVLVFC